MDLGLKGKKALVTGGTRGIGRAIADLFVEEGCDVAICARTEAGVNDALATFRAAGVNAYGEALDAGDGEALAGFVDRAAAALGGLHVYVSNVSGAMMLPNDPAGWRTAVEVDILAAVRGCEAAVPHLDASGDGAVIIIDSIAGVEITMGPRRPYNTVKAALLAYVKSLARDVAPKVRVNAVSPGAIYFAGGVWEMAEKMSPDRFAAALARQPMGRMGKPQEVAAAVAFLASPRSGFTTGSNLICDGGTSQRVDF